MQRYRYQILAGLVLAVLLPTLIRASIDGRSVGYYVDDVVRMGPSGNALTASFIALVMGISLFRRMCNFPGVRGYEYVLPSFLASYGLVISSLLIFRFGYTVSVLAASIALAVFTFFVICYLSQRYSSYLFHVVPRGDMSRLHGIEQVEWIYLQKPMLPVVPGSGIVVDLNTELDDDWERLLAEAALAGVPVYHSKQLLESMTGQVEIEHISENSFGSLNPNEGYGRVKQMLDFVLALVMVPLIFPGFLLVALLIRLDSKGPIFFRQVRMGFRGKPFEVLKLRTMHPLDRFAGHDERKAAMTQSDDDRITRVGRVLRRTRMDEIPQILNILRGEMSWIGPRPEAMALSSWYQKEISFYSYRHVVKPGITGWAQVNQGHVAEIGDVRYKLCYDFYYIKYLSAWLDALIVFRTIRTIVTGSGAK